MWWKKGGDFVGLNCFLKLDWNLWCIFEFLSGLPCPFIWCCQIQNFLFDRVKYEFHSFPPLLWKKLCSLKFWIISFVTSLNSTHCRFLVPGNTQKILTEIWHHFWLKMMMKSGLKNIFWNSTVAFRDTC